MILQYSPLVMDQITSFLSWSILVFQTQKGKEFVFRSVCVCVTSYINSGNQTDGLSGEKKTLTITGEKSLNREEISSSK